MNMSNKHEIYLDTKTSINTIEEPNTGYDLIGGNCCKNHGNILAKSWRLGEKAKELTVLSLLALKQVSEFLEDDE
jgi:hypothetical protein